ncbi:uncharacterized protein LOC116716874 [Xiphophorus hellerii]|uniref:uncharacterized protein LOC116716874 n=1 Tax=Xiphophorus hellerii TaxID=8084 RepID=UPI0013B44339|nr:uncharacterized protein LOC116716874 [Xiphophorus hellerii]
MDVVTQLGLNMQRSVLVTGTQSSEDEKEIVDRLQCYGAVKEVFHVSDPQSTFYKNLIVEFEEDSTLNALQPLFPYNYPSRTTVDAIFRVTSLASEYAASVSSSSPPMDYIDELKNIAKRSGKRFEEVLKGVMDQISTHLETTGDDDGDEDDDDGGDDGDDGGDEEEEEKKEDILTLAQSVQSQQMLPTVPQASSPPPTHSSTDQQGAPPGPSHSRIPPTQRVPLSRNDLIPQDVQRVVVEHVVKNSDFSTSSLRLRSFSGKIPKPSNEADYDSWRSQIELLLADPSLSRLHVNRRIVESLLSPAADLIKCLSPGAPPSTLLQVLDSAFQTVQDGEELFAQFLNIFQNPGERPSSYLQRLQLTLNTVIKRGGILPRDKDTHLLKQFCRGCWDNSVISKLQLEEKKSNPPPFSELLLSLRTEEDRQIAKESLMRKHIHSSKQKVTIQSQSTCSCGHVTVNEELKELKKQIQQLQRQMSSFMSRKTPVDAKSELQQTKSKPRTSNTSPQTAGRPKPGYCFNCGEDGHMSSQCSNKANPSLVEQKKKQLRQKQQAWDGQKSSQQLN